MSAIPFTSWPLSTRDRSNKSAPLNPRPLNFFPPSLSRQEHQAAKHPWPGSPVPPTDKPHLPLLYTTRPTSPTSTTPTYRRSHDQSPLDIPTLPTLFPLFFLYTTLLKPARKRNITKPARLPSAARTAPGGCTAARTTPYENDFYRCSREQAASATRMLATTPAMPSSAPDLLPPRRPIRFLATCLAASSSAPESLDRDMSNDTHSMDQRQGAHNSFRTIILEPSTRTKPGAS